jgi:DNA-binding LytR/AlgR family response regulator
MHLTVARGKDGETGLVPLEIEDIIFLEFERIDNRINVHTLDDVYYIMGTLKFWVTALQNSGYDFVMVDRVNAANINKIVRLDKQYNIAYFETDVTKESKGCTVAWNKFNLLIKKLQSMNKPVIVT